MEKDFKNVGVMTIPKNTTEEMLAIALYDLLEFFSETRIDQIKYACEVLGHPPNPDSPDTCFCGETQQ